MNNKDYLIDRMNPFLKIIILIIITIIGSLDFKPFVSIVLIISAFIIVPFYSRMSIGKILNSIKLFITMSLGFMSIILITRYLSGENLEIITVLALGLRIILISVYSSIFVKTTDPTEFVLVLIKYFKMPVKAGYAFLTAYRFLPTFQDELEIIKYAHQVRGIVEDRNPLKKVWNSKRYILPMMANAVRKGIRVSMAMETRAFGKYKTRTNYRKLHMKKDEVIITIGYIIYIILVIILLYLNNLTSFKIIYKS